MYDAFISYGHDDATEAHAVANKLRALGRTVWIDSPEQLLRATGQIGIPAGQPHWQVISEAIAESATFLVVDSADWRDSAYCARELEHARTLGVRVAVLTDDPERWPHAVAMPPGAASTLFDTLAPGDEAARHFVRLLQELRGAGGRSLADRVLGPRRLALAATTVLFAPQDALHPVAPPDVRAFAKDVLATVQRKRRNLVRGAMALACAFALMATTSIISLLAVSRDRAAADHSAAHALSLDLASQALLVDSPRAGQDLAQQALAAQDTPQARSALSITTAALRAADRFMLPSHQYQTASFSPSGERFAVTYRSGVVVARTDGEMLDDLATSASSRAAFLDENRLLVASHDAGQHSVLSIVHLDRGLRQEFTQNANAAVSGFERSPDGTLWWWGADGSVGRVDPATGTLQTDATLPPARDATVASGHLVRVLDGGIVESRALPPTPDAAPQWQVSLDALSFTPGATGPDRSADREYATVPDVGGDRGSVSSVRLCGDTVHVLDRRTKVLNATAHVALRADDGTPVGPVTEILSPATIACLPSGGVWLGGVFENLQSLPSHQWAPAGFADPGRTREWRIVLQRPDASWTAVLFEKGDLSIVGPQPALQRTLGQAMAVYPLDRQSTLVQLIDGSLHRVDAGGATSIRRSQQPWAPVAPLRQGRFLASNLTTLAVLTPQGVGRTWPRPDGVRSATPTADGSAFTLTTAEQALLYDPEADAPVPLPLPELKPNETLRSVLVSGERLFITTTFGRLLSAKRPSSVAEHEVALDDAGAFLVATGSGVAAVTPSGVLQVFDETLKQSTVLHLGYNVRSVAWASGSDAVAIRTNGGVTLIVDLQRSIVTQRVREADPDAVIWLTPDGTSLVEFVPYRLEEEGSDGNVAESRWAEAAASGVAPQGKTWQEDDAHLIITPLCHDCA